MRKSLSEEKNIYRKMPKKHKREQTIVSISLSFMLLVSLLFCGFGFTHWYNNSVVPEVAAKQSQMVETPMAIKPMSLQPEEKQYLYFDIDLSLDLQEYTQDACDAYNIPTELALAVMQVESQYQTDAVNGQCVGLFQINLDYADAYYENLNIENIEDPKDNILCGIWYLSSLIQKYDDLNLALMNYNLGNKANELWEEGVTETEYTRKVIVAILSIEEKLISKESETKY